MKPVRIPLQPYERDLIRALGCTEDEYRQHVLLAMRKAATPRPAAYDRIPDVQATPAVFFFVNLAVGLLFSAVSYLLAPKPRAPKQPRQPTAKETASITGRTRFNETSGFESGVSLAEYGAPVAILFGRYNAARGTGGIVASPALVWSRMRSFGNEDGILAAFIVGEASVARPDLAGIFLGNQQLTAVYSQQYAVYWVSRDNDCRPKSSDLLYGTRGSPSSGDPDSRDYDILATHSTRNWWDAAFCGAFVPTNNREFGAHSPVRNGTAYRLNLRAVSYLKLEKQQDDPKWRIRDERKKISGLDAYTRNVGQRGEGRGYSCRCGLIAHRGIQYDPPTSINVSVGDELTYYISDNTFGRTGYNSNSGVDNDDIQNATDSFCIEADEAMQLGEVFICGRVVMQCVGRDTEGVFDSVRRKDMYYRLRVIEILPGPGSNRIGLAGTNAITRDTTYEGFIYDPSYWVGTGWYPLLKVNFGIVRNTRPVDCTEVGFASEVWNQANGLCNFSSFPSAKTLEAADEDMVQVTNGTITSYLQRSSGFTVQVRKAGTNDPWRDLNWVFIVTSSQPTTKRYWIRFMTFPGLQQIEYRFVPVPGASLVTYGDREAIQVDARAEKEGQNVIEWAYNVGSIGTVRIEAPGQKVRISDFTRLYEMELGSKNARPPTVEWRVAGVTLSSYQPLPPPNGAQPAYIAECLGLAAWYQGVTITREFTFDDGTRAITWSITARSAPANDAHKTRWGQDWYWVDYEFKLVSASGAEDWRSNSLFFHKPEPQPFLNPYLREGVSYAALGAVYGVLTEQYQTGGAPQEAARRFELDTQVADISHYNEINKSNNNKPEHSISWVNEIVPNDVTPVYTSTTLMALALRASRNFSRLDAPRLWLPDGVPVARLSSGGTGPSNLITDLMYHLYTSSMGAGSLIRPEMLDKDALARTGKFLEAEGLFFDGAISERQNLSTYFSNLAPLFMCDVVKKNGKLALTPALPINSSFKISTDPVPIAAIFNSGNIKEGSFTLDYLSREERRGFRAVGSWRTSARNQLPETRTAQVRWADVTNIRDQEEFDMTPWCTNREQVLKILRFIQSVRRRVEYSCKFTAFPDGLKLAPGDFIRVNVESAPYSSVRNGIIHPDTGVVVSVQPLGNGSYPVVLYRPGMADSTDATLTISGGKAVSRDQWGGIFTVKAQTTTYNVFMVESLDVNEEALVDITGIHHPVDANLRSQIALDVLNPSLFAVAE